MIPTFDTIQRDELAMTVARILAIANQVAASHGTDLSQSLITITEESAPMEHEWRVHYGPRDYKNRRGGDLMVYINGFDGEVRRIVRGQ